MIKGDPDAPGMIRGAFKEAMATFLPHKE
jgi:hypothetical protein